jgi:hypothetical protein
MIEFINMSLFVFWICGSISVLVDMDHIWSRIGREPPVNPSKWVGRPLHTSVIFSIIGIIYGCFVAAFVYGLYVQMATGVGILGTLSALSGLNIVTLIVLREFDKFVIKKGLTKPGGRLWNEIQR